MKAALAATGGATAAVLVASGLLGVAAAEGPATTPPRTVSVQGVANAPVPQGASAATATGVYRQAMAAAVTDAKTKAEFLAEKVGAALGAAQQVAEGGGAISCSGEGESRYVQYEGEEPDFGYGSVYRGVPLAAAPAAPAASSVPRPRLRKRRHTAVKAASTTCTLTTQVSLVYAIG